VACEGGKVGPKPETKLFWLGLGHTMWNGDGGVVWS
jgi:hypothetical protein